MKALLLVDIQCDFVGGGSLAVPGGEQIISLVNRLQAVFSLVVATKDWHPANHGSFALNHKNGEVGKQITLNGLPQVLWPVHCVQNTQGADFAPGLDTGKIDTIFFKGTNPETDSYSGFFDNGKQHATGLDDYLKKKQVDELFICGLATDYCVKFSALDAKALGFQTYLIKDACRAVNLSPTDEKNALSEMENQGIQVIESKNILK